MFDQITDKTKKTILEAQKLVRSNGQGDLQIAHLIISMFKTEENLMNFLLERLLIDKKDLENRLELIIQCYPKVADPKSQGSHISKKASDGILSGIERSKEFGDQYLGIDFLLEGLFTISSDPSIEAIREIGEDISVLKEAILEFRNGEKINSLYDDASKLSKRNKSNHSGARSGDPSEDEFETEENLYPKIFKPIQDLASDYCIQSEQETIELAHLMKAIIYLEGIQDVFYLEGLTISLDDLGKEIDLIINSYPKRLEDYTYARFYSTNIADALQRAWRLAKELNATSISPALLLYGILSIEDSPTAQLLSSKGLHKDILEEAIIDIRMDEKNSARSSLQVKEEEDVLEELGEKLDSNLHYALKRASSTLFLYEQQDIEVAHVLLQILKLEKEVVQTFCKSLYIKLNIKELEEAVLKIAESYSLPEYSQKKPAYFSHNLGYVLRNTLGLAEDLGYTKATTALFVISILFAKEDEVAQLLIKKGADTFKLKKAIISLKKDKNLKEQKHQNEYKRYLINLNLHASPESIDFQNNDSDEREE